MQLQPLLQHYLARFQARYARQISPAQHSALTAMLHCRTERCGEILLHCPGCPLPQSRFHSCGHRSCPRCQHHDTTGCFNPRRRQWKKAKGKYLFNTVALAKVFRGRFLSALQSAGYSYPATTPKNWVAHCQSVSNGLPALQYLSRYLYRGVISENNIIDDDGTQVTFRYTVHDTGEIKTRTLAGEDFLWLLLQHVLPKGFRRVRDYGFLHGNAKKILLLIQLRLRVVLPCSIAKVRPAFTCCRCHQPVIIVGFRKPAGYSG